MEADQFLVVPHGLQKTWSRGIEGVHGAQDETEHITGLMLCLVDLKYLTVELPTA